MGRVGQEFPSPQTETDLRLVRPELHSHTGEAWRCVVCSEDDQGQEPRYVVDRWPLCRMCGEALLTANTPGVEDLERGGTWWMALGYLCATVSTALVVLVLARVAMLAIDFVRGV